MNVAELAEVSLVRLGERMVLDFDGERFTNRRLLEMARRLHRGLARLGLSKGDVAALCMANHPVVYPVFQGIFRTGATAVPVMFLLAAPELHYILSDTEAVGVITDELSLPKVREAVRGLGHVRWIVVRGGSPDPGAAPAELSLEALLEEAPLEGLPSIADDDVAMMMYTSGTTGKPKGAMLTHRNLIASAEAANDAAELELWEGPLIGLSAMPMAHIFGVGVMNGGYLVPEHVHGYNVQMAWFDTEGFLRLIQQHRSTSMVVVPTMLALMLNHPNLDRYDLSSLKQVVSGAAPLPREIARAFSDRCGCRIREIYGQTESTGIGSANRVSDAYRPGSAGRAYCNTELAIFDDEDRPAPRGVRGEIVLRGPAVMKGYHRRPQETADTLRGGWLHTGDIGYLDEEGFLYVCDRKKDLIIRGGENIYPGQLEEILYSNPGVQEAAVVGAPDPVFGEKVVAYVVARDGLSLSENELAEFMRTQISPFKVPSRFVFVDGLPKTLVGKVLKRELRERAAREAT
ncbi:MAG: AMP-binding protein [bacterium]